MLTTSDVLVVVGASETLTATGLVGPFSITSEVSSLIGFFCVCSLKSEVFWTVRSNGYVNLTGR